MSLSITIPIPTLIQSAVHAAKEHISTAWNHTNLAYHTAFNETRGHLLAAWNRTNVAYQTTKTFIAPAWQPTSDKIHQIWTYSKPHIDNGIQFLQTKEGAAGLCFVGAIGYFCLSRKQENRALSLSSLALSILGVGTGAYILCTRS